MFSLNQEKTDTQENLTEQQHALETSIAKMMVSDYEEVKEIEFTGWGYSPETNSWGTTAIINKENRVSFLFDSLSGLETLSGYNYHPDTFKLEESPGFEELLGPKFRLDSIEKTSLDGVKIIHSKNQKED
ncbi:hypothetical protein [Streptococcus marimammalium]